MPKLTVDGLKKLREQAQKQGLRREGKSYRVKVTVHMGTCGIASGAREIMKTLMDEIKDKQVQDVYLTASGCAGMCSHEPMATVEFIGKIPVKYIDLTPEKTKRIFSEHIVNGILVQEYALGTGSERTI
ncbi:MAG: (2Fe-2S) ferredoxin domain-containing protein [Acidobacteriota bacterium]